MILIIDGYTMNTKMKIILNTLNKNAAIDDTRQTLSSPRDLCNNNGAVDRIFTGNKIFPRYFHSGLRD